MTRGSGHKLDHRRFLLNIKKQFLTVRETEHGNRNAREAETPWRHSKATRMWSALGDQTEREVGQHDLQRSY